MQQQLTLIDLFLLACYTLAAYRMTHLLVYENGPWDVIDWLRHKAGVVAGENGERLVYEQFTQKGKLKYNFWGHLLICPLCVGFWMCLVAFLLFLWGNLIFNLLAVFGAMWAVLLLLFRE